MKTWKISKKLRITQQRCILFLILVITAVLIMAWNSRGFTNWYRLHIFPIWMNLLGRISDWFSGSVGEILILAGICLVLLEIVLLPLFAVRRSRFLKYRTWNFRLLCWIFVYIYGTETLNCFVMYHASTVEEQYFQQKDDYGREELIAAYTLVVTKAN